MADRLVIDSVEAFCRIGVTEQERQQPQSIWIDLELAIDAARAAKTDALGDAVDYARLVARVRDLAQAKTYQLLETLAEEVAALVLKEFATPRVLVRVKKRALPMIGYAAVEIVRERLAER